MKRLYVLKMLNNLSFFDHVSLEDFYLLASLETDELNFIADKTYLVTPLLNQIASFSLIFNLLSDSKKEEIQNLLPKDSTILSDVLSFSKCCSDYIEILLEEECLHPTVINLVILMNEIDYYREILFLTHELLNTTEDERIKDVLSPLIEFNNSLNDISDRNFFEFIRNLSNNNINSSKQLLNYLRDYIWSFLTTRMLLSPAVTTSTMNSSCMDIYYMEDWYIHVINDSKIYPDSDLKISDAMEIFTTTFMELENYFPFGNSEEKEIIKDLKDSYLFYENYKYQFLKNKYCEQKLIEKCKKM